MILVGITDEDSDPEDVSSIDVNSNTGAGISVGNEEIITGTGQRVELWRIMDEHIQTGSNTITVNFGDLLAAQVNCNVIFWCCTTG